ncbi:MAG: hypothetical protein WAU39_20620, partial [Polyangiales bacterium]
MPAAGPDLEVDSILHGDASAQKRKNRRRYVWGALTLTFIVGIGILATVLRSERNQYKTEEVHRGNLVVTVTATGNLEPTNQVEVGVEVSGTIATVEVDYNDR